jgi:hypothetical protein
MNHRWAGREIIPQMASNEKLQQNLRYHAHCLARRLKALGRSPQQPAVYARERDDALVRAWLTHDWPSIKKRLAASKRR